MTIQGRGEVIAIAIPAVLLTALLVFGGYGWLQEHDARMKAEAAAGQRQKQIDGLKLQQADAQNALNQKLAALEKTRQTPATATQLVSDTAALLPGLPVPLQVVAAPKDPAMPNAPATQNVIIPEADFKTIQDAQITCEENAARLVTCQSLAEDSKQQLQLTERQRDEWKTAAKGGSIWHRALGAAKWFGVGAATGAGFYAVSHHR
jgi:hypothetical protein